ncbi:MAG: hypothetical protein ACK464_10070 [Bacteroidota bacterium]
MDFPIVDGLYRDIHALGGRLTIHQSAHNGTHEQQKQSVRYRL